MSPDNYFSPQEQWDKIKDLNIFSLIALRIKMEQLEHRTRLLRMLLLLLRMAVYKITMKLSITKIISFKCGKWLLSF